MFTIRAPKDSNVNNLQIAVTKMLTNILFLEILKSNEILKMFVFIDKQSDGYHRGQISRSALETARTKT